MNQYFVAIALLVAAWRLLLTSHEPPTRDAPHPAVALPVGAGLGFVSGLTGVGGGIFLSPLLLFLRWVNMRTTAPRGLPWMMLAAIGRATVGSELAVRRLAPVRLRQLLGVVLIIAAVNMILTA